MPRRPRIAPKNHTYHVLNRAAGRLTLFRTPDDYAAFTRILLLAHEKFPLPLFAFCLMPNHWHFLAKPTTDTQLTDFFRWLAHTHAMRFRTFHRTVGHGPLYQSRFKNFPVQGDHHFLTAARYIERNPLSANLVKKAHLWPHASLNARQNKNHPLHRILSPWPLRRPPHWPNLVQKPLTEKEHARFQLSLKRSRPFGDDRWTTKTAATLGLTHTLRPEGRPKKQVPHEN